MLKRPYYEEEVEYHIHWETANTSFIKMAMLLKRAGVENYDFFLRLYDEDLMHIDPYDPDITPEEMGKVAVEVARNYYYFLREVARIPEEGASTEIGGGTPFGLHRGNLAQAWCFEHNISHFLELPRQFGKTTGAVQRYMWQFSYGTTASSCIFMNMDKAASVENLNRLKNSRSLLPEYLQMVFTLDEKGQLKKEIDNVNEIHNKKLKNNIKTKASARNQQGAERIGRGLSVPSLWFDELAHMPLNDTIFAAAMPAFSRSSENAAKNGKPYGVCITTTPGDLGTTHGDFSFKIKEKAARFTESLYDMDPDEIETWMSKNSSNKFIYIKFSFLQLGKTHEWFEDQCQKLNHHWVKIRRELLLQWNKAASNSPFAAEDIDELDTIARPPIKVLKVNKYYEVLLYREIRPDKRYLIGVDVSKGVGRDATAVAIVEADTLELVGLFINNVIRTRELKRFLLTLVLDMIPNSVLMIESNMLGSGIIEDLKDTALKHYLYYEFPSKQGEQRRKDGRPQPNLKNRMVYGHEVTSVTRPRMMALLLEFVAKYKDKIAAKELVDQIKHLEYKNEERIDHAADKHDDAIFAYLACIYIMFYGTNLPRFGLFNRFNFNDDGMEEIEPREDKVSKVLKQTRLQRIVQSNPYLAGLFEDLITTQDVEKQYKQELIDSEISDFDGGSLYVTDSLSGGAYKTLKPNAFLHLNGVNSRRMDSVNNSIGSVFGVARDRLGGDGW